MKRYLHFETLKWILPYTRVDALMQKNRNIFHRSACSVRHILIQKWHHSEMKTILIDVAGMILLPKYTLITEPRNVGFCFIATACRHTLISRVSTFQALGIICKCLCGNLHFCLFFGKPTNTRQVDLKDICLSPFNLAYLKIFAIGHLLVVVMFPTCSGRLTITIEFGRKNKFQSIFNINSQNWKLKLMKNAENRHTSCKHKGSSWLNEYTLICALLLFWYVVKAYSKFGMDSSDNVCGANLCKEWL